MHETRERAYTVPSETVDGSGKVQPDDAPTVSPREMFRANTRVTITDLAGQPVHFDNVNVVMEMTPLRCERVLDVTWTRDPVTVELGEVCVYTDEIEKALGVSQPPGPVKLGRKERRAEERRRRRGGR